MPTASFSLFRHCQGRTKEQRMPVPAPLCPGNGAGRRSGRSPAEPYPPAGIAILSPAVKRGVRELIEVRRSHANVKELHWTFSLRKNGHFKPRFCGHFGPRLTLNDPTQLTVRSSLVTRLPRVVGPGRRRRLPGAHLRPLRQRVVPLLRPPPGRAPGERLVLYFQFLQEVRVAVVSGRQMEEQRRVDR